MKFNEEIVIIQSLLDTRYGKYSTEKVKQLLDQALTLPEEEKQFLTPHQKERLAYIITLNSLCSSSARSDVDFNKRVDALCHKWDDVKKEDFLAFYESEKKQFNQLKFLNFIFSEDWIHDIQDWEVLKHRNLIFSGIERMRYEQLHQALGLTMPALNSRYKKLEEFIQNLMTELSLFRNYFPPSIISGDREIVMVTNELADHLNTVSGVNFTPRFYLMLINQQNQSKYYWKRIFDENREEYIMIDNSLIKPKEMRTLINLICEKSEQDYIRPTNINGTFTSSEFLDRLIEIFHVEIKIFPDFISCYKSKWAEYARVIKEIIPPDGIKVDHLLAHMKGRGYKIRPQILHRLIRTHDDLYKKKDQIFYFEHISEN